MKLFATLALLSGFCFFMTFSNAEAQGWATVTNTGGGVVQTLGINLTNGQGVLGFNVGPNQMVAIFVPAGVNVARIIVNNRQFIPPRGGGQINLPFGFPNFLRHLGGDNWDVF